jgi:hypothetical protein
MSEESKNLEVPSAATPPGAFKVPNVPKVTYQDPQSISTSYGWGNPVDFVLPNSIGKVIDMVLQIDFNVTGSVNAPPTPYWFERLEVSLGGSAPIETTNKDECFVETLAFLDVQDFQTIAPMVNINANGSWNTASTTGERLTGTGQRLFLPLYSNCLMTMQPYLKGFTSEWKLRFILSQTAPVLGAAATGDTFNITGLRLLITEAQLPPAIEGKLARQHERSVVYNTINRLRHTDTKVPTSAGDIEYTLTTFGNESAGVLCYYRAIDSTSDYSKLGLRAAVNTINLRDAQGNPYYATDMDGNFNLYFVQPWSVKGEPLAGNRGKENYLLPFSSHVGAVLEDGRDLGAYQMSGKERIKLNLTPTNFSNLGSTLGTSSSNATGAIFVAVSYDYMRIKVKGGKARVYYQREVPAN